MTLTRLQRLPAILTLAVSAAAFPSCTALRDPGGSDGALGAAEFEAVLLDRIMAYGDADGDGSLSYEEWSAIYTAASAEKFRAADADGDGKLNRDEAEASTRTSPIWHKLMAKIDLDADGVISRSERDAFIDVMAKADDDDQVNMLRRIAEE